jgi:pimeloyl-ACP methyl ester carboxylesterase
MIPLRSTWLLAAALAPLLPAAAQEPPEVRWEPYTGKAADGSALEGRIGRIRVPENRSVEDGETIELAFVVYESESPDPGPPIYFLVGGPGGPGIEMTAEMATHADIYLLDHGDVVGIDQRGTGLCVPNLGEGPEFTYELPLDRPVTREELAAAYGDASARCYEYWTEQGVDLSAYNSAESADDVDAVRAALGHEQIIPWGTSYGSHLGLAYLRRHPERVDRAVLMKVEGPDHTFKLPSLVQLRLEHLSELVAADPGLGEQLPDFAGTVAGLIAQLEAEPVTITTSRFGEELSVTLGPLDLQIVVSTALGSAQNAAGLPAAVHLMTQGEFGHMLGFVMRNRRGDVGSAMPMMMDCASWASPERLARIERERADPANVLGDAILAPYYPATCEACGSPDLGDEFRAPLKCDVPVLFVSGDLDARTPPENVEEIRAGFSDHAHVLVVNTGHDARELMSEEYCELVNEFLMGERVESATIELPPLEFRPIRAR